jgi:hypothetical protein
LVSVYKDNIAFARLTGSDNIVPNPEASNKEKPKPLGGITPPKQDVKLMANERELTTGLLSKDANFRLIVSGPIGVKEIERLIRKLELDKEILAEQGDQDEAAN